MLDLTNMGWAGLGSGAVILIAALAVRMDNRARAALGVVGGVLIIVSLTLATPSTQPQSITTTSTAQVQITNLANVQGMTVENSTNNLMQVAAQVPSNGTFYGGSPTSGIAKFHFYLQRTDQGTHAAVFAVNLASNPSVYNSTNSKSYTLIQQYSGNKTNEVTIAGSTGGQALVSVPSAGDVEVNVSMTLNAYAISSMSLYSSQTLDFQVSLGGVVQQTVAVNVVYAKAL